MTHSQANSNLPQRQANDRTKPLISVVVPVYKEQASIRPFLERAVPVLERLGSYEIIFCLDPSTDDTEVVIRSEMQKNPNIGLLVFSRRFGQAASTLGGIFNCRGLWCAVIDVDLQDPPEIIEMLLRKAQEGFDVVAGRRSSRKGETFAKKWISHLGYKVINAIADVPIPRDTGDFRVMSRRVVEELRTLSESHGFLRGMVSLVGFSQTSLDYERDARVEGKGNYNQYFGSFKVGLNGIVGFSTFPLELMTWVGFAIALVSALAIVVVIFLKLWLGDEYPLGIPTLTIVVLFLGGVQLTSVGVLGEYVGRIYDEVRQRPMYIVDRFANVDVQDPRGPRSGAKNMANGAAGS